MTSAATPNRATRNHSGGADQIFNLNVGRHLMQSMNLNTLPYGSRFLPQSLDPTASGRPYPDTFLRPYVGYGDLSYTFNVGTSNYNGLQVGLNRRFSAGVQLGFAYTWSKALGA